LITDTSSRFTNGTATRRGSAAAKATRLFRLGTVIAEDRKFKLVVGTVPYDPYIVLYRSRCRVRRVQKSKALDPQGKDRALRACNDI
jgi:hypothetical protein